MPNLPRYQGGLFDSARWAAIDLRPGDVIVATPPKSGTTWTMAMIYLALHGPGTPSGTLSSVAPWVDFHGGDPDAPIPPACRAEGRRLFKTHTPLDGLPPGDGVKVVTVFRDPGDCFLSMRRHLSNMAVLPPGHPNTGDLDRAFEVFLNRPLDRAHFAGVSLSVLFHHLRCARVLPVLTLHYADLMAQPDATLRQIARHAGISLDKASEADIVAATGKAAMRQQARTFAPEARTGLFKDDAGFFSRHDQAVEGLSAAQRSALHARVEAELGTEKAAWLCRPA